MPTENVTPTRYCTNRAIRSILNQYCPKQDARVLDVGCGDGYYAFFNEAGISGDYLGIDIEAADCWSADKGPRQGLTIDFMQYDAEQLSEMEATYSFVISLQAMEHFIDDDKAFKGMSDRLEPGGYLFLTAPSSLSRRTLYPLHGRRGFVRADFHRLADTCGLELVQLQTVGGLFSFIFHFLFWTIPFFGPIPISKKLLGRRISFQPWKYYPLWLVSLGHKLGAVTEHPSFGLEGGYAVVFLK